MKKILCIFIFLSLLKVSAQEMGFYSINTFNNHLVFIDTLGSVRDIGNSGVKFLKYFATLGFQKNDLYCLAEDTLYKVDIKSGNFTFLGLVKDSLTSNPIIIDRIIFNSKNEPFVFNDPSGPEEGSLYRLNMTTQKALKVSSNTSGNASVLAVAFDKNDSLFGVSESGNNLLKIDTASGMVCKNWNSSLDMDFATAISFTTNGGLWGIDISNEYSSTTTRFCKIDPVNGTDVVVFSKDTLYSGLAWGPAYHEPVSSINKNQISTYNVIPNPSNGTFSVEGENFSPSVEFRLSDVTGKQIKCEFNLTGNRYQVTTKLSDGLYFLSILQNQFLQVQKIIIHN